MNATDPLQVLILDPESTVPPYRQLHHAVVRGIEQGKLTPGQKMPTTRGLAAHLGLAVNTVAAAYRALEESGLIVGRGRAGTFIALDEDPIAAQARRVALGAAHELRQLGLQGAAALELFSEAVDSVTATAGGLPEAPSAGRPG